MTQTNEKIQCIDELKALFVGLDEKGQETALAILRALEFAQSVMYLQDAEQQSSSTKEDEIQNVSFVMEK